MILAARRVACMLGRGAAHHFSLRVSDWYAATVILSFGLTLLVWPSLTHTFGYFAPLVRLGPPDVWGAICLVIGVGRIGALTINGTFPLFRWSPHLRMLMASMSCFVWFQVTLGLLVHDKPTMMVAVFPQLLAFDLYNLFLAASETGVAERAHRHGRG